MAIFNGSLYTDQLFLAVVKPFYGLYYKMVVQASDRICFEVLEVNLLRHMFLRATRTVLMALSSTRQTPGGQHLKVFCLV